MEEDVLKIIRDGTHGGALCLSVSVCSETSVHARERKADVSGQVP